MMGRGGRAIDGARLLALVGKFDNACMDLQEWPAALEAFCEAFRATAGFLGRYDYAVGTGVIEAALNIGTSYVRLYSEHFAANDAWMQEERHYRRAGIVLAGRQILPHAKLLKTKFYDGWLRPQGMFHSLRGILEREGTRVVYVAVTRPHDAPRFGVCEANLFRLILPHLQRAILRRRLAARLRSVAEGALEALDCLSVGVALVDAEARVLAANATAMAILVAGDGLAIGPDGIEARCNGTRTCLKDLLHRARANGGGPAAGGTIVSLARPAESHPLGVLVQPLRRGKDGVDGDGPAAAVFICDPERRAVLDEKRLCQLYGLTRAEARIVARLADGQRLERAAADLGIGYQTARTHLKRVFDKTVTARQADLMRLVLTGPARIRSPGQGASPPAPALIGRRERLSPVWGTTRQAAE